MIDDNDLKQSQGAFDDCDDDLEYQRWLDEIAEEQELLMDIQVEINNDRWEKGLDRW